MENKCGIVRKNNNFVIIKLFANNQDGYYVVSFERYYDAWFDAHYLDKEHNLKQYVKITALE